MTITHDLGPAPVDDFALHDQPGDMRFLLGNPGAQVDGARRKWFSTDHYYTVPEFEAGTRFGLDTSRLAQQLAQARGEGVKARPVIVGPLTYLWLGTTRDGSERLDLLPQLLTVYTELLAWLRTQDIEWVQVDEPALVTELDAAWRAACATAYDALAGSGVKLLLTACFGPLKNNLALACSLPVDGLHLDAINARSEIDPAIEALGPDKVLSLGVIDGCSVWKTDLHATLAWLEPVQRRIGARLWIAPSCSLRYLPPDLAGADADALVSQKLGELRILARALDEGRSRVQFELVANAAAVDRRVAA